MPSLSIAREPRAVRRAATRAPSGRVAAAVALVPAAACSRNEPLAPDRVAPPTVADVAVSANPTDVLALDVGATVGGADSVRLRVRVAGEAGERVLPAAPATGGRVSLAALGLPADTAVTVRVEALGVGGDSLSAAASARTGPLPEPLRDVRLAITGTPTPGYLLTGLGRGGVGWAVAFDSAGTIAWYRAFPEDSGVADVQQQPNGDITAFVGSSHGWEPLRGHYAELRPTGEVVRSYEAPDGYYTDSHEIRLVGPPGAVPTAYFFGYDRRPTDLTSRGGAPDSLVAWHAVFRTTPDGATARLFESPGHFTVDEWIEPPASGFGDVDHPNSLDLLPDGDLLVSWRNLGQVTRIDPATGAIRWRLGGTRSDFTFVDDPQGGFSGQHFVRRLDDGHLLLYDNGIRHVPSESRAAEYVLDERARTATLVREYRYAPARFTIFTGDAQRRANGNTLVAWAWTGGVTEVTSDGAVAWDGQVMFGGAPAAMLYRLLKAPSLYAYQRP